MQSAEAASYAQNARCHSAYNNRIRNSLQQALILPWDTQEVIAGARRRSSSLPVGMQQRKSIAVDRTPSQEINSKMRRASVKAKIKNIHRFEIILNKRMKPNDVQSALTNFRTDSISSIRDGVDGPKLKDYVDLHSEAYEPGEVASGHIQLILTQPLAVKSISARLRGTYIVAFELRTEGESTTSTEQVTFLEEEALLPVAINHGGRPLEPGSYKFSFSFKLPLNIPSTMFFERFQTIYEGASVVYSVEAVMNIEEVPDESFNSPVAKEIIEIMKRVSERQDMTYQRPYKIFKPKKLSCCCFSFGEMSLAVTLNRLIYMEGETMVIDIKLSNNSSKKVKQIDIALVQYSSFKSKSLQGYVLKSRLSLLAHHVPMQDLGFGDAEQTIALTLPDKMQSSTIANIVPPNSFHSMHVPKEKELVGEKSVVNKNANASEGEAEEDSPVRGGGRKSLSARDVKFEEVPVKDEEKSEKKNYIVLLQDWHMLYEYAYYIQVKARSSSEWFNMKGPEIHFPITIESADKATRKKRDMLRKLKDIEAAEDKPVNKETDSDH